MKVTQENVVKQIIRQKVTSRGGGVEISLSAFGFPGEKMAAFQNYLGGGMLGGVCANDTIRHAGDTRKELQYSSEIDKLKEIAEVLKRYFHNLTDPGEDTWEGSSYEDNQKRAVRAY